MRQELRLISDAIAQYAIATNRRSGDDVHVDDWVRYLKKDTRLQRTGRDILGNDYDDQKVDEEPKVPRATWDALEDVADEDFWRPFKRKNGIGPKHKTP